MNELPVPDLVRPYLPLIKGILIAVVILVVGWMAGKWAHRLTRKALGLRQIDQALVRFLAALVMYAVLAATFITALGAVGIQTTSMVAVFASAGLAIGLALQGSLANFASGVMLLLFRPFTLGDRVTAGGQTGVIEEIGLFATTMLSADNETIVVPNTAVTAGTITNYTARGVLRGHVEVTVAFGNDVPAVLTLLTASAGRAALVLREPAPAVAFKSIGPRGLQFDIAAWSTASDFLAMLHNVRLAAHDDLRGAGIEGPPLQPEPAV